jgi:hypothetical protein
MRLIACAAVAPSAPLDVVDWSALFRRCQARDLQVPQKNLGDLAFVF